MLPGRLRFLLLLTSLAATAAFAAEPGPQAVSLWPSGAATLKGAGEKEVTVPPDPQPGQPIRSIRNVHNPSIELHLPPADRSTGAAVIVAPGGGHQPLRSAELPSRLRRPGLRRLAADGPHRPEGRGAGVSHERGQR
jgi:hypothetical protein